MTNDCKTCPVSTGTHKPAEAVHQIDEPQADALRLAAWLLHRGMSGIKQNDIEASNQLRWLHAESLQHKQELAAYRFTVENREARIAELEDDLQFVERWAVHHGSNPSISAEEALSCIQHYPAIHEITKSYKDGKRPDTFNPYARIAELEGQLEAIGAGGVEPLHKPAAAPQEEAIAEIVSASHDQAEFGERGINFLRDFQHLEYGTKLYPAAQAVQPAVPDGWQMVPAKPTEAMVGAIMSEGEVDAVAGLAPELRPILLERAGIAARYTAMLAAAPAHPAEGVQAQGFKTKVYQALGIGSACNEDAVFVNIANLRRRADCLSAIEREFFMVETPPDESEGDTEPGEECLLNWCHDPEEYVKQFAEAIAATQPAAQGMDAMTPAARDVLAERKRQIEAEGWKTERDDVYDTGEMALAAACYAAHSASCAAIKAPHTAPGVFVRTRSAQDFVGEMWPWSDDWWKPSGHRRNLEKAAALILAEIERIDRAALAAQAKQGG